MGPGPQVQRGAQPPQRPRSPGHTLPGLLPANDRAPPREKQGLPASQSLQRRGQSRQASETRQGTLLCLLLERGCVHPRGSPPQTRRHAGSSSPPSSPLLGLSRPSRAPEPDPEARPSVRRPRPSTPNPLPGAEAGCARRPACVGHKRWIVLSALSGIMRRPVLK